eukprot:255988_1
MQASTTNDEDSKMSVDANNEITNFNERFVTWFYQIGNEINICPHKFDYYYCQFETMKINDIRLFLDDKNISHMLKNRIQVNSSTDCEKLILIIDKIIKLQHEHAMFMETLKVFNIHPIICKMFVENAIFTMRWFKEYFPSKETFKKIFDKTSLL